MRVIRRLHDDERGAVLALYALGFIAIVGMLALTLDLGRAVATKRDMVNGADAAALGAAQECAIARNPASAQAVAEDLTAQNRDSATVTSFSAPDCDGATLTDIRTVTVHTQVPVDYVVAPIVGFDSVNVTADAVAVYGPVAGAAAAPISVNYETLLGCQIPTTRPNPGEVVVCPLSYPKDELQEPRWGILDLSEWDDPDAAPCHVSASEARGIIVNGGYFPEVWINPPPQPTWDCLDNGLSDSVWEELEGRELLFPVIDIDASTGQTKPGGADCTGVNPNCQIDTANVIAFVLLYVPEGGVTKHGSTVFVEAHWAGSDLTTSGLPGPAPDFGAYAVRLVD